MPPHPSATATPSAGTLSPTSRTVLATELVGRAQRAAQLREAVAALPGAAHRRQEFTAACQLNSQALQLIVADHGWPTRDLVGDEAALAAVKILLHSNDQTLHHTCQPLIADAVSDGRCPPVIAAYIDDLCAVGQGQPQCYGTQIDGSLRRPHPIRDVQHVDARRHSVGLGPLNEHLAAVLTPSSILLDP